MMSQRPDAAPRNGAEMVRVSSRSSRWARKGRTLGDIHQRRAVVMGIGFDVAGAVGPQDRHQHQRGFPDTPQGVVRGVPQRRLVGARRGERRLEVGTDELDLAQRTIDRLECQRGMFRQHLGIVEGGVLGGVDRGQIAGAQIGEEDGQDHRSKEYPERGNGAFRAARQFARERLQQHCQPGREPRRCGDCHRGIGRELEAARIVLPEIQK
jgi:hypothetical protein